MPVAMDNAVNVPAFRVEGDDPGMFIGKTGRLSGLHIGTQMTFLRSRSDRLAPGE
jgi:hypothetical protein